MAAEFFLAMNVEMRIAGHGESIGRKTVMIFFIQIIPLKVKEIFFSC